MTNPVRFAGLLIALSLLTATVLDTPAVARRSSLRARKAAAEQGAAAAREKIRALKQAQVAQRGHLTAAQQLLRDAQSDLHVATQRLSSTRSALIVVRREHQAASKRHVVQKKRMEARVLAQFEAGNPSYLEVVLGATSFADFTWAWL